MLHYHVHVGMPGYIPADSYYCETLTEARQVAKEEKGAFLDYAWQEDVGVPSTKRVASDNNLRVTGNIRTDWGYSVDRRKNDDWEGWQVIEIVECQEEDCAEEDTF